MAAAMLSGCGGSGTPLSPSPAGITAERTRPNVTYGVLYRFKGDSGGYPVAGLISVNGTLYGTTDLGGAHGKGTIFAITTSGKETVLHSFKGGSADGEYPQAGLLDVNGTLYGTSSGGGAKGSGTVFAITTSGKESVLYGFRGASDGASPQASLINVNGVLYGTTFRAGAGKECGYTYGCGTVFAITLSGKETVLHSFGAFYNDGALPSAGLVNVNGALYGTTNGGGANGYGGTVFSITTSGKEKLLHSFLSGDDGQYPQAGLINVKGTLYGTTSLGGAYSEGTVFGITTSGKEFVLYSFKENSEDGENPFAGVININGLFYGTTRLGGAHMGGTVFATTTSGKETVLHSFGSSVDGTEPMAGLVNVKGTLYGTTSDGGGKGCEYYSSVCGTVFALKP